MQDSNEESFKRKQAKSNNMTSVMKLILDKWLSNLQPCIG